MKQHITVDQLNQAHLLDTLNLAVILNIGPNDYKNDEELDKKVSEGMTIGEMIGMLNEHYKSLCVNWSLSKGFLMDEWYINKIALDEDILIAYGEELADCLWEAVLKEVL